MNAELTNYEWYRADGKHEAELPAHRDPREYSWGMFTRDGRFAAAVGMFMWFSSGAELAAYLREVEPQIQDVSAEDLSDLRERIEPALSDVRREMNIEEAREALNAAQSDWTTDWWGTFESLCVADGEWEKGVREGFLELHTEEQDEPDEDLTRPLTQDEHEPFITYLSQYGF